MRRVAHRECESGTCSRLKLFIVTFSCLSMNTMCLVSSQSRRKYLLEERCPSAVHTAQVVDVSRFLFKEERAMKICEMDKKENLPESKH